MCKYSILGVILKLLKSYAFTAKKGPYIYLWKTSKLYMPTSKLSLNNKYILTYIANKKFLKLEAIRSSDRLHIALWSRCLKS